MEKDKLPKPGQIYNQRKDKPYQIITVAAQAETKEQMVVYQELYGDFKTYVRPLEDFLREDIPVQQDNILQRTQDGAILERQDRTVQHESIVQHESTMQHESVVPDQEGSTAQERQEGIMPDQESSGGTVNRVLMQFLDADSYYKKLEVITSNRKHMDDRLVNDIAVSLDCAVEEGPIDQRIQSLILCLQAMCRFEDRRQR